MHKYPGEEYVHGPHGHAHDRGVRENSSFRQINGRKERWPCDRPIYPPVSR